MPTSETGRPRPRTRNAGATRATLVGASVSHFTEEGFARTSVDRVVAGLDLTKGAAYHHFKDKTQLFEAAFEFVQARFSEQLGAAVSGLVDPDTILATSLDQYLTACRDPSFLRIAVLEAPAALGWERWKEMEAPHLLGVLRAALAKRSGDPGAASSAAPVVLAAASAAGLELSTVSPARVGSERRRLVGVILAMAQGLDR